jgi:DNA-binding CsgD family transcriptional regulator
VPEYILGQLQGPENPLIAGLSMLPQGVLLSPDRIVDEVEVQYREFYDIMRLVGIGHVLAGVLDRSAGYAVALSLTRSQASGPFTEAHEAMLGWVLPHLTAAALVRRRLAALLAEAMAPRCFLEALDRGVLLVDAASRIAHANAFAERLLARHDGLIASRDGRLVALRPDDTARLRRLIALAAAGGAGRKLHGGGAVSLPRRSGRPYVVQVLPLAPNADLGAVPHLMVHPAAALVVSDPDARPAPSARLLQEAYDLTPAEAALAARLAAGSSLQQAAEALDIGANTAKTQLKAIFAKLEVDRQAALVQRVLAELGGYAEAGNGHAR